MANDLNPSAIAQIQYLPQVSKLFLAKAIGKVESDADITRRYILELQNPEEQVVSTYDLSQALIDPVQQEHIRNLDESLRKLRALKSRFTGSVVSGGSTFAYTLDSQTQSVNKRSLYREEATDYVHESNLQSAIEQAINDVLMQETILIDQVINKLLDAQIEGMSLQTIDANGMNVHNFNSLRKAVFDFDNPNKKLGGGPVTKRLKDHAVAVHNFMTTSYDKLKRFAATQIATQVKRYEELPFLGKLTYVEGVVFRLMRFCLERTIGKVIPLAFKTSFLFKVMHLISIFTSFVGVSCPPLMAMLGMTSIEAIVKLALLSGGLHTMGVVLGTNVCILLLYFMKKTITTRGQNIKNFISRLLASAGDAVDRVINEVEKQFDETIKPSSIPDVDINTSSTLGSLVDEDNETIQAVFNTTFDIVNATSEFKGKINKNDSAPVDPIELANIKLPRELTPKLLKKINCALIERLVLKDDRELEDFRQKINMLTQYIERRPKQGGRTSDSRLANHLLRNSKAFLSEYYYYQTGSLPIRTWTKSILAEKIIAYAKSHNP